MQIELNRGLYMNETTYGRTAGFDALRGELTAFLADLLGRIGAHEAPYLMAAE